MFAYIAGRKTKLPTDPTMKRAMLKLAENNLPFGGHWYMPKSKRYRKRKRNSPEFYTPPASEAATETELSPKKSLERNEQEYIYFLRKGKTNRYKIGYSNNPLRRKWELQVGNDYRLNEAFRIPVSDGKQAESCLKKKFKNSRCIGEWHSLPNLNKKRVLSNLRKFV